MDWIQFILLFLALGGLFLWNRAESRSDMRNVDSKLQANSNLIMAIREETSKETKDFHARLCVLEEKYIQMMQRILEKRG